MKNSDKVKYVYSGYGIAFDGKCECNVGNDLAKNLALTILNNDFLLLGEDPTFGINGRFSASEKKLIYILIKQRQNFAWVYNNDNSYLFVNGKEI